MSDSDSFINEVTEEVRRDRLYGYLRRYGWIAVVVVLLLVGGAAWNEIRKSQATSAAQATGDALLDALANDDPQARMAAMTEVSADGPARAVTDLLTAATQQEAGDISGAMGTLEALAINSDVPEIYRDLAAFKAAMINPDPVARRAALGALAMPGAPFSLLAQEQLALADLAEGNTVAAAEKLQAIAEDAGVSRDLRRRAQTLMVSLGEVVPQNVIDQ